MTVIKSGYVGTLLIFAICAALCLAQADLREIPKLEVLEFLQEGFTASMSNLSNIRAVAHTDYKRDPNHMRQLGRPDAPTNQIIVTELYKLGGKEHLEIFDSLNDFNSRLPSSVDIFDGLYRLSWYSTKNSKDAKTQIGRAVRSTAKRPRSYLYSPTLLFGQTWSYSVSDVLFGPSSEVELLEESVFGLKCYKLTRNIVINGVKYDLSCWVSLNEILGSKSA